MSLSKIDELDELTAVIRLMLFLYKYPCSKTTKILKSSNAGQKAFYSAKKFLEENNLLEVTIQPNLPYNPLYSLSDKGRRIADHLFEIEKILECNS